MASKHNPHNMIDVKTIRISSIVANKHGFQFEVVGILKDQILCDFKGNEGDVFEFKPSELFGVPLSEEWMVNRFGFTRDKDRNSYFIDIETGYSKFDLMWYDDKVFLKSRYQEENLQIQCLPHIKYVHQLQNLISALTGEELKLK